MSVYLQATKNAIAGLKKMEFPYTPQIEYGQEVKYDMYNTTHTNYQLNGYTRTENPTVSMTCKFSAHTTEHFKMSEFAIRFLRTYTKMNYGRLDPDRGQPPRILRFFAHGNNMFNDVPVVLTKFSMTLPEDVDYVRGSISNDGALTKTDVVRSTQVPTTALADKQVTANSVSGQIYLPIIFSINISMLLQYNMYKAVNEFNLEDFANGKLSSRGYI
jgi:hypothetical protein